MNDNDKRLIVVAVLVVGLLGVVAIVVSAFSIARNGTPELHIKEGGGPSGAAVQPLVIGLPTGQSGNGAITSSTRKIFLIGIGHDYGAHEYFDAEGYLQGFGLQMINLICAESNIECRSVWVRYESCWDSHAGQHASGGKGLHGQWFDACVGWYTTIERSHIFQFSQPYLVPPKAYFYVKKGSSFNAKDLAGKRIGFVEAWATDEKCVARQKQIRNRVLDVSNIDYSDLIMEAINKVKAGTVDAMLLTYPAMKAFVDQGLVDAVTDTPISCMVDGNALMARKDSDLPALWNVGFNKARSNGRFAKLCAQSHTQHGHKGQISCMNSY